MKSLADETKLEIIRILLTGKKNVTSLSKVLRKSQPNTSIALKNLLLVGLITQERQGREVFYRVKNPDKVRQLIELLEDLER